MICYGLSYHNALNSEKLFRFGFTLLALTAVCLGKTVPIEETSSRDSTRLGLAVMDLMDEQRRFVESIVGTEATETFCAKALGYLESLFGPENVRTVVMFMDMVLRFVAEGAASGFNVIAVYVSEILRVTGVGDPVYVPHFTADGVFLAAKWALIAVIGYWLLCVLLRVAISLLKRLFWLLKLIVVAWLLVSIASEPSASLNTAVGRLVLLVVFCAVLNVATRAASGTNSQWIENSLKNLEERVTVLETKRSDD